MTAHLADAGLASKILRHQVAADAVHARELASLQLKYATKTTELDAAHTTREGLRPRHELLDVTDYSDGADDLNSLKAQYNKLAQGTALSRSAHRTRVAEVQEAQAVEASGLQRETRALASSLQEVDATFDASVKTLETQLLLLLRSKLEAAAQQEIDGKRQLLAEVRARRDVMMRDQQEHVSDLEALKQRLEDQLAAHAARVTEAARDALAQAQADLARQLQAIAEDGDGARQALQAEIDALLQALADARAKHDRAMQDAKRIHGADVTARRATHAHELRLAADARAAKAGDAADALEDDMRLKREQQARDLASLRDAMTRLEKQIRDAEAEAAVVERDAPPRRAALKKRRDEDLLRFQAERKAALEAQKRRRQRELDEAALNATDAARQKGRAASDALIAGDDAARLLDAEAERLRRAPMEANKRGAEARRDKAQRLASLEKDHRRAMAAVVVDPGDDDSVLSAVRDDLGGTRAMASARRKELILSDTRAAADELRTDCASYADALASLQRALGAERAAHGAQVRRQQAELDAKESELALLHAERGADRGDLSIAHSGSQLLDTHELAGDDPVMAEWRKLVQSEKTKGQGAVAVPAGAYVHSKRWGA